MQYYPPSHSQHLIYYANYQPCNRCFLGPLNAFKVDRQGYAKFYKIILLEKNMKRAKSSIIVHYGAEVSGVPDEQVGA